jgi:hypothetical protein
MPLVIREHQRKYHYIVSKATRWQKMDWVWLRFNQVDDKHAEKMEEACEAIYAEQGVGFQIG